MSEIMKLCGTRDLREALRDVETWMKHADYALTLDKWNSARGSLSEASKRIDAIREEIKAK